MQALACDQFAPTSRRKDQQDGRLEFGNEMEYCDTQASPQQAKGAVEIAPNPSRREYGPALTFAEEMDARNREKILQRKIKNRQAAARSYAKKRQRLDRT